MKRSRRPPAARPAAEGEEPGETFTIGELAHEHAITTRAIRFYETRGLLAPARDGVNRSFTRRDRGRLGIILRGKNLGFTLEEIAEYLELYDTDPAQEAQTRHLLKKVEAHIASLNTKRADLVRTLRELKQIRSQCVTHLARSSRSGGS